MTRVAESSDDDDAYEPEASGTHLDDAEYDAFLAREFDGEGRPRRGPRMGLIVIAMVLALVVFLYLRTR